MATVSISEYLTPKLGRSMGIPSIEAEEAAASSLSE